MNISREEKKVEAIRRMKKLGIFPQTIKEFEEENKVNYSENGGFLYWADEQMERFIKELEDKYNMVIYHIIKSYTEFGTLLSCLYVEDEKEEWGYFDEDIADGICFAYVANIDCVECSEFGSIGIESRIGGLVRVA